MKRALVILVSLLLGLVAVDGFGLAAVRGDGTAAVVTSQDGLLSVQAHKVSLVSPGPPSAAGEQPGFFVESVANKAPPVRGKALTLENRLAHGAFVSVEIAAGPVELRRGRLWQRSMKMGERTDVHLVLVGVPPGVYSVTYRVTAQTPITEAVVEAVGTVEVLPKPKSQTASGSVPSERSAPIPEVVVPAHR